MERQLVLDFVKDSYNNGLRVDEVTRTVKKEFVTHVLTVNGGNQCRTAKILGWHRNTLARQLGELEIDPRQIRRDIRIAKRKQVASVSVATRKTLTA